VVKGTLRSAALTDNHIPASRSASRWFLVVCHFLQSRTAHTVVHLSPPCVLHVPTTVKCFKANSHIPCRAHAVHLPCRAANGLDCVFPIWFTLCGSVWYTCHAAPMPRPCHNYAVLKANSHEHFRARHGNGMCELASAVQRRLVGGLMAFGFLRLPPGIPRRLLSEVCQSVKL
jgi:hypothetical protein